MKARGAVVLVIARVAERLIFREVLALPVTLCGLLPYKVSRRRVIGGIFSVRIPDSFQCRWIHETERLVIPLCIAVTFVSVLSAQTKPNFSGHWKLNSLESDFGVLPPSASRTDIIEHNEPALKISTDQTGSRGTQSDVVYYATDGQDCMNKIGMLDVRSKVSWQGNNLVVASIVYLEEGQLNSNSIWTLSDNGRTMTQRTHLMIANREIEQKLVFDRTDDALAVAPMATKTLAPVIVQAPVNYSGVWRLVNSRSNFGSNPGPDVRIDVIDHHEPVIKIDTSQDSATEGKQEYNTILTTDGRASASHFRSLDAKSTSSWVGQNLVVNTRLLFQGSEVAIETTYVLSDDGRILTQYSHIKSPTGDGDERLVFEKQ